MKVALITISLFAHDSWETVSALLEDTLYLVYKTHSVTLITLPATVSFLLSLKIRLLISLVPRQQNTRFFLS